MVELCKKISESKAFTNFILIVIGIAAVVVGMQTYKEFEVEHRAVLNTLDALILGIFIFEIIIKIVAKGRQPQTAACLCAREGPTCCAGAPRRAVRPRLRARWQAAARGRAW